MAMTARSPLRRSEQIISCSVSSSSLSISSTSNTLAPRFESTPFTGEREQFRRIQPIDAENYRSMDLFTHWWCRGAELLRAGSDPPAAGRSWWQDLAMETKKKIGHWVGGKATPGTSDRVGPVYNPATGEQSAAVALASADDVSGVVATAAAAAQEWSASSLSARAARSEERRGGIEC